MIVIFYLFWPFAPQSLVCKTSDAMFNNFGVTLWFQAGSIGKVIDVCLLLRGKSSIWNPKLNHFKINLDILVSFFLCSYLLVCALMPFYFSHALTRAYLIRLDPLRDFWGHWTTFIKNFFSQNPLLHAFLDFWGGFLASNSLHSLRGQK